MEVGIVEWNYPLVHLLVVDDAPTELGRELRGQVAEDANGFVALYEEPACLGPPDPGRWNVLERYVVLVGSSGQTLISPAQDANLAVSTKARTTADVQRFEGAVAMALQEMESSQEEANLLYEQMAHWADLIQQRTVPESDAEQAVLQTLPERSILLIQLLTTRDDESMLPVKDYFMERDLFFQIVFPGQVVYRNCLQPTHGRLAESNRDGIVWPCPLGSLLGRVGGVDCQPRCASRRVSPNQEGQLACRFEVHADIDRCPDEVGWTTPPGGERVDDYGYRVCEIRQLTGRALESCRTDLTCADCAPGWCLTEVPEIVDWGNKPDVCSTTFQAFRFVGGANQYAPGLLWTNCLLP